MNPFPTENLCYDSSSKIQKLVTNNKQRRKLDYKDNSPSSRTTANNNTENEEDVLLPMQVPDYDVEIPTINEENYDDRYVNNDLITFTDFETETVQRDYTVSNIIILSLSLITMFILQDTPKTVKILVNHICKLESQNKIPRSNVKKLAKKTMQCKCKEPLHTQILETDADALFFTGLPNKAVVTDLHDFVAQFVHRRWKGYKHTINLKRWNKKISSRCKLSSKDGFLLTFMKLRLGLLHKDLSKRFKISTLLSSQIFTSWVKALSKVLKAMIFVPDRNRLQHLIVSVQ